MADVESVNDQIHDELIPHDVDLLRVTANCKLRVEQRLDQLVADLSALAVKIDPHGATRKDARERRLARFEKESRKIISEAYREIDRMCRKDLQRVAVAEQEAQVSALEGNIP